MRQVIVTGGGTGIGLAVAAEFARLGDQVTITGRREQVLKDAAAGLPGPVGYACFDASDPHAVAAALPQLPDRVDVLVNNAGGNTDFDREPAADGDLAGVAAAWRANLDANLLSAVLVTAALTARFAPDARIISLSSIAARRGAGSYGAAKAGGGSVDRRPRRRTRTARDHRQRGLARADHRQRVLPRAADRRPV